ncbi:hypothetical protein Prudu_008844 [Prunus dulcis]|uniref:Uncharacterized protein n=1 Tax=Prunus dulcis TaxID=3755 RepID=A0A4Y1R533_PRUDU|nr:hypothetical protein Prudu_008844 [Prunus dulcis]
MDEPRKIQKGKGGVYGGANIAHKPRQTERSSAPSFLARPNSPFSSLKPVSDRSEIYIEYEALKLLVSLYQDYCAILVLSLTKLVVNVV